MTTLSPDLADALREAEEAREVRLAKKERDRATAAARRAERRAEDAQALRDYCLEHYGVNLTDAEVQRLHRLGGTLRAVLAVEKVPVHLLRERLLEKVYPVAADRPTPAQVLAGEADLPADGILSTCAIRAGFVSPSGKPDTRYVLRALGLKPWSSVQRNGKTYPEHVAVFVSYEVAVRIARGLDLDPYEAGV